MVQKEVSKVGIFHKGKYLMGVRQDTGKWTEPGGHLHRGEDPLKGALREVKEETGIALPKDAVEPLGSKEVVKPDGTKLTVHAFKADLKEEPRTNVRKDPDHEVFGWDWIPVRDRKLPPSVSENLHVPSKDNVLHFFLGFEKKAFLRKTVQFLTPSQRTKALILDVPGQVAQSVPKDGERKSKRRSRRNA
jgi:8-oxo-dGTP pyrophosphatase MutT (NUDIX family)